MRRRLITAVWVILAIGVVTGISAAAIVFADAQGTASVAVDAAVELRAEEVLSAASASRSLIGEILTMAAVRIDPSDDPFVSRVAQARESLDELGVRTAALIGTIPGNASAIEKSSIATRNTGSALLTLLETGHSQPSEAVTASEFSDAYLELIRLVVSERDARERHISAVREGAANVAQAARFLVAFFIPALAILAFLWLTKREQVRRQVELALRREQDLRVAKDEFLAAVSHELRTPLTGVVGFAETLLDGRGNLNTGERNELIETIADQAQAMAAIVEDLLVLARVNTGELTVQLGAVDVRDMIDKVMLGWSRHDRARATVKGNAVVSADDLRLRQILRNLLTNAIGHGGRNIEIRITPGSPTSRVEVADDGPGIPAEDRARVFEAYRRISEHTGQPASIGLGLTVARSLAQIMDGELAYRWTRGESIFELSLPTASADFIGEATPIDVAFATGRPTPLQIIDTIERDDFRTVFQPIVDLTRGEGDGSVIGYEALTRFATGSPQDWFSSAEEAGLRLQLELATIRKAVIAFQEVPGDLFISLNVSVQTLVSSRLLDVLEGLPSNRIVLELTEEAAIRNYHSIGEAVAALTAKGFRLAIDDMGTGQADLWQLVRIRPAVVKLDLSLIRGIDTDPDKRALVNGLKWHAEGIGSMVVAEGIETPEELDWVRKLGIHWGQGYLLGRPADLPQVHRASLSGMAVRG